MVKVQQFRQVSTKLRDYGCTLKVFRNEMANNNKIYGELHRFIPVLVALEEGTITQVDVRHHPRIHEKTKYGISQTLKVLSDLLVMLFLEKFHQKPMHLFGGLSVICIILGVIINFYLLVLKLMGHDIWGKPIMMLGMILLLGGIQLITIGLIAEIQIRTYFESKDKKSYRIRKIEKIVLGLL